MKRAFTLIELLVVIAIIAILAAILFPVFAQAKISAKAAASLANIKQQDLAVIMYEADFADYVPLSTAWNTGNDPLTFGTGLSFSTWAYLVQPYIKNGDLHVDPLAPPMPTNTWPRAVLTSFQPTYGYNYTALSGYSGGNPGDGVCSQHTVSATAPGDPVATVMLSSKFCITETQFGITTGAGFAFTQWVDNGPILNAQVDAPECYTIVPWCQDNWGPGMVNMIPFWHLNINTGAYTGGNTFRAANNGVVGFMDGHVKKLTAGNLAVGTNFSFDLADESLLVINDLNKYMWDIN